MNVTVAPLAHGAPDWAHRVQAVLHRAAPRFDGREDLLTEKASTFVYGVRSMLSPDDWSSPSEVAEFATALRIAAVRSAFAMARVNPRTRAHAAQTIAVIRDLHTQVLKAIEED